MTEELPTRRRWRRPMQDVVEIYLSLDPQQTKTLQARAKTLNGKLSNGLRDIIDQAARNPTQFKALDLPQSRTPARQKALRLTVALDGDYVARLDALIKALSTRTGNQDMLHPSFRNEMARRLIEWAQDKRP